MLKNLNIWFFSSLIISLFVAIPIITVFTSFFDTTSNYYEILKETFLIEYILNSLVLLSSVLALTFVFEAISKAEKKSKRRNFTNNFWKT